MVLSRGGDGFEVRFLPLAAPRWVPSEALGPPSGPQSSIQPCPSLPLGHGPLGLCSNAFPLV